MIQEVGSKAGPVGFVKPLESVFPVLTGYSPITQVCRQ